MTDQTKHPGGRPSKYAIYELRCPDSGAVRYVGQTKNPKRRRHQHCFPSTTETGPKVEWARSLAEAGKSPVFAIVEWATDWDEAERRWVATHRARGADLLNVNDGGRAPSHMYRRSHRASPPSAVTFLIRKLRLFARDLAGTAKAKTFTDLADGIARTRREIARAGGKEAAAQYEAFIASSLGDRWTPAQRAAG